MIQLPKKEMIKLNVGGNRFTTSRITLLNIPDTILYTMFSGHYQLEEDDKGYFFIDRDGTNFR